MTRITQTLMTVVVLMSATIAMAGNVVTETYPIKSNYTAISAMNMIEVKLIDAPKNTIRVEADERLMPHLQITIKDGVLTLNYDDQREVERLHKRARDLEDTQIYVSMRGVDSFIASGKAEFEAEVPIEVNTMTINASGMAEFDFERVECKRFKVSLSGMTEIDTDLNADECDITISGMSEVDIEGRTNTLKLELSGMSEVSFDELYARNAKVNISGMSSATVYATESITGSVSGMSKLTSYGSANQIEIKTSGGSSHKHVKR